MALTASNPSPPIGGLFVGYVRRSVDAQRGVGVDSASLGPARPPVLRMLRLKALGLNGADLPLPSWTDDHATFLKWALCPDDEALDLGQPFSPVKSNREHWQTFIDHWNKGGDERFEVLLWATPTPTGYAIGWGTDRILIHARHPSGPHMVFSS